MRFRLMFGRHVDTDPATKHLPADKQQDRIYQPGEEVESDQDLCVLNGRAGDARKFERIDEDRFNTYDPYKWDRDKETLEQFNDRMRQFTQKQATPPAQKIQLQGPASPVGSETFRAMSAQELQKYAEDEEIDLCGAKDKESMVKAISTAKTPQPQKAPPPPSVVKK